MNVCFVCVCVCVCIMCRYEVASVGFLWCVEKARERWGQTQSPERSELLLLCYVKVMQYNSVLILHAIPTCIYNNIIIEVGC